MIIYGVSNIWNGDTQNYQNLTLIWESWFDQTSGQIIVNTYKNPDVDKKLIWRDGPRASCFLWGVVFLHVGRLENEEHVGPISGPNPENIIIVQKVGSKTKMWNVGCDRMVFAINSNLFLIKFN